MTITRAVLITGPLGCGKTSVSVSAGELLDAAAIPNAVIDLDWLCWAGPALPHHELIAVMCDNLTSLRRRYSHAGIHTLALCRAVTSHAEIDSIRAAVGGHLVAFRLSVPADLRADRLRARANSKDLAESAAIDLAHESEQIRHIPAVKNHGRSAELTAHEVLTRLGWLSKSQFD